MKKFLVRLTTFICIILLEFSTTALLLLLPLQYTVSKKSIKELMMNYSVSSDENDIFMDAIRANLKPLYKESEALGIEDEVIQEMMETKEVKEFVADITSDIIDYVFIGEEKELFTEEDLKKVAILAIDQINKEAETKITEVQKQEILDALSENSDAYLESMPKVSKMEERLSQEEKEALHMVRFLFSKTIKIYLGITLGVSLLGIILLKRKEAKWLKTSAIVILTSSMITLLGTLLLKGGNSLLFREEAVYVYQLFEKMIQTTLFVASFVAFSMILLLILYHFLINKKKDTAVTTT